ncbi:hypothetical protein NST08_24655 [Paenibacillus sp. FSL K6-1566]|uniref:hypothetical protein n=1 Tax=Paenibacillus sp. FSL K6-1566 TaxID=2954515 RepID=UPI003100F8F1
MDKMTQEMVDIVKAMPESHARKTLARIFAHIQNIGYGGKTKEDAFNAIQEIYKEEVAYPSVFNMQEKDKV